MDVCVWNWATGIHSAFITTTTILYYGYVKAGKTDCRVNEFVLCGKQAKQTMSLLFLSIERNKSNVTSHRPPHTFQSRPNKTNFDKSLYRFFWHHQKGSSINDVTVLGGGSPWFCEDSNKALVIKKFDDGEGGVKIVPRVRLEVTSKVKFFSVAT